MRACLLGTEPMALDKKLYDVRYFYFEKDKGRYTCGMAYQTLMAIYRKHRLADLDTDIWYRAIAAEKRNPAVQGFLAEQICLATIRRHGLSQVDKNLSKPLPLPVEFFRDVPRWDSFLMDASQSICLYIPVKFNNPDIDAAILRVNRKNKKSYLYLIQVTISKGHMDSERNFYTRQWDEWKSGLERYPPEPIFVWIGNRPPDVQQKEEVTKSLQSGQGRATRHLRSENTEGKRKRKVVSIKDLDNRLYDELMAE
jgi:hypothetical protein